jgi:hypothetical protein
MWILMAIFFIVFFTVALASMERVSVSGTVIEHNVTADKGGRRIYSTIVRSDDGLIEEVVGLKTYIVPVGSRVRYEKTRYKY